MPERFTAGMEIELHKKEKHDKWNFYLVYIWDTKTSTIIKDPIYNSSLNHKVCFSNEYIEGQFECWGSMRDEGVCKLELVTPDKIAVSQNHVKSGLDYQFAVSGKLIEFLTLTFEFKSTKVKESIAFVVVSKEGRKFLYERSFEGFVDYFNDSRIYDISMQSFLKLQYDPSKKYSDKKFLFEPIHTNKKLLNTPLLYTQLTVSLPLEVITSFFAYTFNLNNFMYWDGDLYNDDQFDTNVFAKSMHCAVTAGSSALEALLKDVKNSESLQDYVKVISNNSTTKSMLREQFFKKDPTFKEIKQLLEGKKINSNTIGEILDKKIIKVVDQRKKRRKSNKLNGFFSVVCYVVIIHLLNKVLGCGLRKDSYVFLPKSNLYQLWIDGLSLTDKLSLGLSPLSRDSSPHIINCLKKEIESSLLKLLGDQIIILKNQSKLPKKLHEHQKKLGTDWDKKLLVKFSEEIHTLMNDDSFYYKWKGPIQRYLESIFTSKNSNDYEISIVGLIDGFRMLHSSQYDTKRQLGNLDKIVLEYRRAGGYDSEAELRKTILSKFNDLQDQHNKVYEKFNKL